MPASITRTPFLVLTLVATLLLAAAPAPAAPLEGADLSWSNDASPGNALVWGLGGGSAVLVASTVGDGTFRSTDNGRHWEPIPGFPVDEARAIAFDPADPLTGYVAGFGGVARTLDGGATWEVVLSGSSQRLAVGPGGEVVATKWARDGTNHVLVSDDQGDTWRDLGPVFGSFISAYGVAFGRTADEIVAMDIGSTYVTHDGGANWTELPDGGLSLARETDGTLWRADNVEVTRSTDGGLTWEGTGVNGWPVAARPGGGAFVSGWEGVLVTKDGSTWENMGYPGATFATTGMLADPENPDAVFLGDEIYAILRVGPDGNGGYALESRTDGFPPVEVVTVGGSEDGSLLLAGGPSGVYASRDGGAAWHHTGAGGGFIGIFTVTANGDGTIAYAGGQNRVFQPFVLTSRDGGHTWAWHGFDNGGDGWTLGVVTHPDDPQRAYAAVRGDLAPSHVFETRDGGLTWESIFVYSGEIYDVAWEEGRGTLLVALDTGVLRLDPDTRVATTVSVAPDGSRTVAADGAVAYAGGTAATLWRTEPGMPTLAPWAATPVDPDTNPRRFHVTDVSAGFDGAEAWATTASGSLYRCTGGLASGLCEDASPAAGSMKASHVTGDGTKAFAAGGKTGIWMTEL